MACGSRSQLEVHHVVPVAIAPQRELDPHNLITLCHSYAFGVNCHLFHGHAGQWDRHNPNVREQAAQCLAMLTMRVA